MEAANQNANAPHTLPTVEALQALKSLSADTDWNDLRSLQAFASRAQRLTQDIQEYDVYGMDALVARLRQELVTISKRDDHLNSIKALSEEINVSRTYLAKFRDGTAVCMNIMNRIAGAFGIRYIIENYSDDSCQTID